MNAKQRARLQSRKDTHLATIAILTDNANVAFVSGDFRRFHFCVNRTRQLYRAIFDINIKLRQCK